MKNMKLILIMALFYAFNSFGASAGAEQIRPNCIITQAFDFIQYGNIDKLKELLEEHPEYINKIEPARSDLSILGKILHRSVADKITLQMVKFAIEKGADVNYQFVTDKLTSLSLAFRLWGPDQDNPIAKEIVQILLDTDASLEFRDNFQKTIEQWATELNFDKALDLIKAAKIKRDNFAQAAQSAFAEYTYKDISTIVGQFLKY